MSTRWSRQTRKSLSAETRSDPSCVDIVPRTTVMRHGLFETTAPQPVRLVHGAGPPTGPRQGGRYRLAQPSARSLVRRSRGASVRCPAGATSFLRIVSLTRCARSAWPARCSPGGAPTPRRSVTACTARSQRGCRCRCDRRAPAQARLRRLVRPRAGHHPHRETPRRGLGGRRVHQRRVPAKRDQQQGMIAPASRS